MKYLFIILLFFSLGAEAQNYTFQKTDCRLEILIGAQIRYSMQLDELTWTNRIGGIEVKDGVSSLYCNGSQITNYTGGQVDSLILDLTTWRLACITRTEGDTLFIGSDTIISNECFGTDSVVLANPALLTWDLQTGFTKEVTLTATSVLQVPTNACDGRSYQLMIWQDGTGSRTLTYTSTYFFPGGTEPTLSTAAGSLDILTCVYNGRTAKMYCVMQLDFKQ